MKPLSPHDRRDESLDDLIVAALHGELTPEERTQFESRLQTDPAAQAAYQEAQAMHDLLEKNYQSAQPDPAFEQRMVSGVRRKLQNENNRETAWESLLALWAGVKGFITRKRKPMPMLGTALVLLTIMFLLAGVALGPITNGIKQAKRAQAFADNGIANPSYPGQVKGVFSTISSQLAMAGSSGKPSSRNGYAEADLADSKDLRREINKEGIKYQETAQKGITMSGYVDSSYTQQFAGKFANSHAMTKTGAGTMTLSGANTYTGGTSVSGGTLSTTGGLVFSGSSPITYNQPTTTTTPQGGTIRGSGFAPPGAPAAAAPADPAMVAQNNVSATWDENWKAKESEKKQLGDLRGPTVLTKSGEQGVTEAVRVFPNAKPVSATLAVSDGQVTVQGGLLKADASGASPAETTPAAVDTRKLIRNAQLDLEVKSFQTAMDQITALTKTAGGYVDTSNAQKGGNGKLQGNVVVKVLPQNLDAFLLKLRDLGEVKNQSVSTDDVTKEYFDTQARLENSRRMETQLQDLLKHANSKVSDLLQVERELGRVRGEIEQMQGQLKLYDFQVQYATVTMQMREKDLNQAAAYLLKEQDQFSLFATDVEGTFQKARATADDFKAQVLVANLIHNSGSDVAAELTVMVAPDQIESFLAQVRGLGRVANFTRQTQRVAKDGGDSDQPANETLTEKDKVQVHLAIRSDDETRKQVALIVVAKAVDDALDQAKTAALAHAGVEVLSSSLNKTPEGQSTAQLSVRVPGKDYSALIEAFHALGRTASFSIQRNDNSGPGANGDDAPVIISLSLTDEDSPLQETALSVLASDVDSQAQQIKKSATAAGVEVKASSFERQPDGTELAEMTFRLPMSKYPAFVETVKNLGKVESLTVRRDDRPDQTRTDDTAPVEITLQLHNQRDIVADNSGLFATLRQTFGDGAGALFTSVRVIGVVIAFLAPWVFTLVLLAWVGRRIYIARKK